MFHFLVDSVYPDDSFAHYWHCLNQLLELVTLNALDLTAVPCQKFISRISCLPNVFKTIGCVVLCWYTVNKTVHITSVVIHVSRTTEQNKERCQFISTLQHEVS